MSLSKGTRFIKAVNSFTLSFPASCFCNKLHVVDPMRARIIYAKKPDGGDFNGLAGMYSEKVNKVISWLFTSSNKLTKLFQKRIAF